MIILLLIGPAGVFPILGFPLFLYWFAKLEERGQPPPYNPIGMLGLLFWPWGLFLAMRGELAYHRDFPRARVLS